MKKYLVLCIGCLPVLVGDCFGVLAGGGLPILSGSTKDDCVASCSNTHCCTMGNTFVKVICPDGWWYNGTECVRESQTTFSESAHRYTTVNYSSCAGTQSVEQAWQCVNYSSQSSTQRWADCCVIKTDGSCQSIF